MKWWIDVEFEKLKILQQALMLYRDSQNNKKVLLANNSFIQ